MDSKRYCNYHKHDYYGNPFTMDVVVGLEDYCKRAVELGHKELFTTNHGFWGNVFEALTLGEKYGLKVIEGLESYYVNDRNEKDRDNRHIIIIALNSEGAKDINRIGSEAFISGYYYKPRIDDELLFSLNPDNVIVTSACVGGIWNNEELVKKCHDYFGDHFYLEVQDHNEEIQKKVNKVCLLLSDRYNIKLIHANDSHYILEEDSKYRDIFLKSKGMFYSDESNFILDYPTYDEIIDRYEKQGVLSREQAIQALDNTLVFDNCEKLTHIDHEIKLPSIIDSKKKEYGIDFDDKKELRNLVLNSWKNNREHIEKNKWEHYSKEINDEINVIEDCHMSPYFVDDHWIAKLGQNKYGGTLTKTGRGCFTAESPVLNEYGDRIPIVDIKIGDYVVTADGTSHMVMGVMEYDIDEELVKINTGFKSKCTLDHKILVKEGNQFVWKEAKLLKRNDRVYNPVIGRTVRVSSVKILGRTKTQVYDLHVEGVHNYVVGNMVVHNSSPSFYTNNLLGLTNIDRISAPITLFPSRFMSVERILGAKSLPDIDLNMNSNVPFIKASEELLGKENCAWMLAWNRMQLSNAFRTYCRGTGMKIEEYENIAKNLDDEIDELKKDRKWGNVIEESSHFINVVDSVAPSPCSMLLYNKPVKNEIGLIKLKDKQTGEEKVCCVLDGYNCDKFKYLKNDYLQVTVWSIIKDVCEMEHIDIPTIKELENLIDEKTWDIYSKGLTCTINQADSYFGTQTAKTFKPHSVADVSAFVAILRPGCASLLDDFIHRKPYTTGQKELDNLLVDGSGRMIYQELIMKYLIWLGVKETKSYDIIKMISKKKFKEDELVSLKKQLLEGWVKQVGDENGFDETWQVVEDAARYSFNASHSLSYAYDSIYGAYLKSHYPLSYYTVTLNYYKGDAERTRKLVNEMSYFGIRLMPIKFGKSVADYSCDKKENIIYKGIESIKYCNRSIAEELYNISNKKYDDVFDLIETLKEQTSCDSRQIDILTRLKFFDDYGGNAYILKCIDLYNKLAKCKQIKKSKLDELGLSEYIVKKHSGKETPKTFSMIDNMSIIKEIADKFDKKEENNMLVQIKDEKEYLSYVDYKNPKLSKDVYILTECLEDTTRPRFVARRINDGEEISARIKRNKVFQENPIKQFTILDIKHFDEEPKYYAPEENELILNEYEVLRY